MDEEQTQIIQERLDRLEGDIEDIFDSLQTLCDGLRALSAIQWPTCPPDCRMGYRERRKSDRRKGATKVGAQKKRGGRGRSRTSK